MAGEKKRRRFKRPKYLETLNQNQISPTTPSQTTLDQPSISIDTYRNLDLRQTGSRSIDQPRSDPDSENRRSSRYPQRRPSFRSHRIPQSKSNRPPSTSTKTQSQHTSDALTKFQSISRTSQRHMPFD